MALNDIVLVLALLIAIVAAGSAFWLLQRVRTERDRVSALENDMRALCNAAVTVGERIAQIERRLRQLSLRQEELGMQQNQGDVDVRSFDQATKMVRKGSSIDEVVEICGLTRGEVELIAMMQRMEVKK